MHKRTLTTFDEEVYQRNKTKYTSWTRAGFSSGMSTKKVARNSHEVSLVVGCGDSFLCGQKPSIPLIHLHRSVCEAIRYAIHRLKTRVPSEVLGPPTSIDRQSSCRDGEQYIAAVDSREAG
jgi:hypothetical protein